MPIRRRKRKGTTGQPSEGLLEAQGIRQQQMQALARTEEQRIVEDRTVVQPLKRNRTDMLENNHVYEGIVRLIREGK